MLWPSPSVISESFLVFFLVFGFFSDPFVWKNKEALLDISALMLSFSVFPLPHLLFNIRWKQAKKALLTSAICHMAVGKLSH